MFLQSSNISLNRYVTASFEKKFSKKLLKNSSLDEIVLFLKNEIRVYEFFEILPDALLKIMNALKTIPLTSVEAERAFSTFGLFVTKIRSSLSDTSINYLCILRNYFLQENE